MKNKFLFLVARNLGDSYIQLSFINSLAANNKDCLFYVWINKNNNNVLIDPEKNIIFINNVFSILEVIFNYSNFKNLLRNVSYLRNLDIKYVVNFYYSSKELFFLRLLSKKLITIKYSKNNSFNNYVYNNTIVNWLLFKNSSVEFKTNEKNIYNIIDKFEKFLTNQLNLKRNKFPFYSKLFNPNREKKSTINIGIAPFAERESKTFPLDKINNFIERYKKYNIHIFLEQKFYKQFFSFTQFDHVKLVSGDLKSIQYELNDMDIFISSDSFLSHYAAGNKNLLLIVLYGPTPPHNFLPPNAIYLSNTTCSYFPCYYKHNCKNQKDEFSCIRQINLEEIYPKIDSFIEEKFK